MKTLSNIGLILNSKSILNSTSVFFNMSITNETYLMIETPCKRGLELLSRPTLLSWFEQGRIVELAGIEARINSHATLVPV